MVLRGVERVHRCLVDRPPAGLALPALLIEHDAPLPLLLGGRGLPGRLLPLRRALDRLLALRRALGRRRALARVPRATLGGALGAASRSTLAAAALRRLRGLGRWAGRLSRRHRRHLIHNWETGFLRECYVPEARRTTSLRMAPTAPQAAPGLRTCGDACGAGHIDCTRQRPEGATPWPNSARSC